jgi:hypothetical protein
MKKPSSTESKPQNPFGNGFCISKWVITFRNGISISEWVLHFEMDPGRFEMGFAFPNGFCISESVAALPNGLLHFRMGCCISEWVLHFRMGDRPSNSGRKGPWATAQPCSGRSGEQPKDGPTEGIIQPREWPAEDFYPLANGFCHHSDHVASLFEGRPPIRKCKTHSEMHQPIRKCSNPFGNAESRSKRPGSISKCKTHSEMEIPF